MKSCLVCLCLLVSASLAHAQTSAEGSIRGYVKDQQGGVLPGATITAQSPTVAGTFTAVTDETGFYRLLSLPPGDYELTADMSGFATVTRKNISVRAGVNLGVDIVMAIGAVAETVQVTLDTPLLETATAAHGVNIKGELQRSLSLTPRRNWSDFVLLTPGVVANLSTAGVQNMFVHGSDVGSHVFQMDGADISGADIGSPVNSFTSSEVLEDVQVKTGGVGASAPLGTGAVVNMITRSGTNAFRGGAFLLWQEEDWSSNNNPQGTTAAYRLIQPDLTFGGPVRRDRAWFFANYRRTDLTQGIARTPSQVESLRALVPGWEPVDQQQDVNATFVKLTARLPRHHQLVAFYEHSNQASRFVTPTDEKYFAENWSGGPAASVRLNSVFGSSITLQSGIAYNNKGNPSELLTYTEPARAVFTTVFPSGGRLAGSGRLAGLSNRPAAQEANLNKLTITADLTYFKTGWGGTHELQTGVYLQPRRLHEFLVHYPVGPGGVTSEDLVLRNPADPSIGTVPFHRVIYDADRFTFRSGLTENYAVYMQDQWRPSPRVTLSAGVRVDRIRREDQRFDVTVQETTAVGPRLGLNVQLTEQGRDILRTSWGRVHDSVSSGSAASVGTTAAGFRDLYDLDLDGTFETTFTAPPVSALTANRVIDLEEYRQPHVDEWSLGYDRQLPGQIALGASLIRRAFRDRTAAVETNGIYENGVFQGYRDEAFNELFRLTSNVWNWPVYTALQLQGSKQTSRLQVIGSYVRQWRRIDGTWLPNDPASFIQPGAFPNDRGIGADTESNSLSGSADITRFGNEKWRDHAVRLAVAFRGPWALRLASSYLLQSGLWSGPVVERIAAPDPAFGPPTVQLSNGRNVSNPLATTIRFAFPTRGDGQFTSPWVSEWSLQAGKEIQIGRWGLEPAISVINLTNEGAEQMFAAGSQQTFSPGYRQFQTRQPPRAVQVSVRARF
jgi:hypothetical protein